MIKNYISFIKESNAFETEVRMMAWLYMVFAYRRFEGGLKEDSWKNDNRMGVKFGDIVGILENQGLVRYENGMWYITDKGIDKLYSFFNPPKTREEWIDYDSEWLKKYNISGLYGYPISKIPQELFEIKFDNESKEKIKYTLSNMDYRKIAEWWVKYQRGLVGWWTQLNKFLGLKNELIPDVDKMILYRGLNFDEYHNTCETQRGKIPVTELKIGDKIVCNKPSWSISINIGRMFASGKKGYGDTRKMRENEIGVVLKHTFPSSELFLDTNWIENNKKLSGEIVLGGEMEVIVRPRKRFVEVIEIFDSTES